MQAVDDFILIKSLGKGNFGHVFLTQRRGRPEYYATKKMDRAICEKPINIKRLSYEISIIRALNHPNIVKFVDLKRTRNHWYLITEYLNGGSLLNNLEKYISIHHKPFPEEIIQHIMRQIVNALYYLHFNKIIHRDLKLENLLLNYPTEYDKNSQNLMNATVKIIDFGFATILSKQFTDTILGTLPNMDPKLLEVIKTGAPITGYNESVDIWSLGTLCYEMTVGHLTFNGQNLNQLYENVKKGTYYLPMTLSRELVSFINGMLQQDSNKRLTAKQLLNHDFLRKHPSQFQPIDLKDIPGSIGPGGVINMKSISDNQNQINDNYYQFWNIFCQPDIYSTIGTQGQVNNQPVMNPSPPQQQQQYTYNTYSTIPQSTQPLKPANAPQIPYNTKTQPVTNYAYGNFQNYQ